MNKVDLLAGTEGALTLSVKTGEGWVAAMAALEESVKAKVSGAAAPLITRARHREAFEECGKSLEAFLNWAETLPPELLAEDLRQAARALGRVAGTVDVEDLLDVVFRDFCIGK